MKKIKLLMLSFLFTTYSYASNSEKDIFDQCDAKLVKLLQAPQSNKEDITNIYTTLKDNTSTLAKGYRGCIKLFNCVRPNYDKTNTYNKINNTYTFLLTQDYKSGLITNCIGYCLKNGLGVELDDKMALKLFTKAVDLGNPDAMNNLADIYKNGTNGVEKDIRKAIELYTKAVELGNYAAMNNLAYIYFDGINGIEKDIQKAIELYTKAVDLGYSVAMYNLAYIYCKGINGVEKDIRKAIELYTKAVDLGDHQAMNNLAFIYQKGINGVEKDIQKAIELYTKAVDLGSSDAMGNLAHTYENEESVKNLRYAQILHIRQKKDSTLDHLSKNEIHATKFILTLFNKGDFSKEFLFTSPQDLPTNHKPFLILEDEELKERWRNFGENCLGLLGKLSLGKYSLDISNLLDTRDDDNLGIWLDVPDIIVKQTSFVPISETFYNSLECLQWEKHKQNTLTLPSHYMGLRLYKMEDSFYAAIGQDAMKYGDEIMQSLEYEIKDSDLSEMFNILKKEYIELLKVYNQEKAQVFLSNKTDGLNQDLKKYLFL